MQEIWKDVLGYEGLYQVSDLGRVKSLRFGKERILKAPVKSIGYLSVSLYKNGVEKTISVHRLVWEAFNGKTCLPIDHIIEGNKLDNRLCNLQAVTNRQNISKHRLTKPKTSKFTGVSWRSDTNKWVAHITLNGKIKNLGSFINELEASEAYQKALLALPINS